MHEHAVLIRMKLSDDEFGEYDEREAAYALEDRLRAGLETSASGECDGHEFGGGYATIYCYGSDADVLFRDCFSIFGQQEFASGSYVIIRRGPSGAPGRRVELSAQSTV